MNVEESRDARDALAKALYSAAFDWIVKAINIKLDTGRPGSRVDAWARGVVVGVNASPLVQTFWGRQLGIALMGLLPAYFGRQEKQWPLHRHSGHLWL